MSFIKKCYFHLCRVSFPLMLAVTGVVLLISLICGTMVIYRCDFLTFALPGFCLPLFFISLIVLFSHILISLMLCMILFDNFRCRINRLLALCIAIIYLLSIIYVNLFFRLCMVVLSLIICACILALHIYLMIKSKRRFLLLILLILNAVIYVYLFLVNLFTLI